MELVVLRWGDDYELIHDLFGWRICSDCICADEIKKKCWFKDEHKAQTREKHCVTVSAWTLWTCVAAEYSTCADPDTPEKHPVLRMALQTCLSTLLHRLSPRRSNFISGMHQFVPLSNQWRAWEFFFLMNGTVSCCFNLTLTYWMHQNNLSS